MKIRELLLKAFGPFTELDLDLSAPAGAVNVLYGENEAGKSSALRALEGFCFGIPDRTTDDHVHSYDQMRIGASLEMANGTRSTFIRRKGKKNTLLDLSGSPMPEEALEEYLCGVGRSGFEALFCLSYKRLNEGSDSILEEGGELGKLLFEARSELSLKSLQSTLSERMTKLYRGASRSSAVIDDALRTCDAQRAITRKGDLKEYKDLDNRLSDLKSKAGAAKQGLDDHRFHRQRLERLRTAIPLVRRLSRDETALADLGPLPNLNQEFEREFVAAKDRRLQAETAHGTAVAHLKSIDQRLSQISLDAGVLTWRAEIERLNTQVEQISRHLADLPKEEKKATEALAEARNALSSVRPNEEPDEANLQIDLGQKRIPSLGRDKAAQDQKLASTRAEKAAIAARLAEAKARLDETSAVQIPPTLASAVALARLLGDVETRLPGMVKDLRSLQLACSHTTAQLGAGDRTVQEFIRIEAPSRAVIQEFDDKLRAADDEVKGLSDALAHAENAKAAAEAEKRIFVLLGTVPTESDLTEARNERDVRWKKIKDGLSSEPLAKLDSAEFNGFETKIAGADGISDRLRREADRAAALSAIESRLVAASGQAETLANSLATARADRRELEDRWRKRWAPTGVEPDSPRQMIDWFGRFEQLGKDALRLEELQLEIEERTQQASSARSALAVALGAADAAATLAKQLTDADALILSGEKAKGLIAELMQQIKADGSSLELAERQIQDIEARLDNWRIEWLAETACLKLSRVPTPEEADEAIKAISTAAEQLGKARTAQKRVQGMQRDHERFADAAETAIKAAAPDLAGMSALAAIQSLYRKLGDAVRSEATRAELLTQQADQTEALALSAAGLEAAETKLQDLCQRAGCERLEDLEDVVERHRKSGELKKLIAELAEQLEIASGKPLGELRAEVDAVDPDTIQLELEQFQIEIERLEKELEQANQAIGVEMTNRAALDTEKTQIDSQIAAEDALARVRSVVRPYLVYTLAESLIRAQIEEFRQANQGPILRRAAEIFCGLTDGSFTDLTTELDDKDQPLLVAIRTSRHTGAVERLHVEALSSATRIGLYLALRLACLYHHIEQREGLPFVADDILLDFDDARARRVMEELGRLAEKTQVILFTHHRHLVEIGQEVLGARCVVQRLARGDGTAGLKSQS